MAYLDNQTLITQVIGYSEAGRRELRSGVQFDEQAVFVVRYLDDMYWHVIMPAEAAEAVLQTDEGLEQLAEAFDTVTTQRVMGFAPSVNVIAGRDTWDIVVQGGVNGWQ